jgi:2,3-bisphosphoglycerate-independent phosphoglycerate mutase
VGKAKYALRALRNNDIVFVHVESPDEAGHEGSIPKKIRAIEDFDRHVVGTIIKGIPGKGCKAMVLPDHPTPIKVMTHTSDPVPFVIYSFAAHRKTAIKGYNEKEIKKSKLKIKKGYQLIRLFLGGKA